MDIYYEKYLKYKLKYINLKQRAGTNDCTYIKITHTDEKTKYKPEFVTCKEYFKDKNIDNPEVANQISNAVETATITIMNNLELYGSLYVIHLKAKHKTDDENLARQKELAEYSKRETERSIQAEKEKNIYY